VKKIVRIFPVQKKVPGRAIIPSTPGVETVWGEKWRNEKEERAPSTGK